MFRFWKVTDAAEVREPLKFVLPEKHRSVPDRPDYNHVNARSAWFTPDNTRVCFLIVGSQGYYALQLRDTKTMDLLHTEELHSYPYVELDLARQSFIVVTAHRNGAAIDWLEWETGKPAVERYEVPDGAFAAFNHDRTRVITKTGNTLHVWDIEKREAVGAPVEVGKRIYRVAVSPDDVLVAVAAGEADIDAEVRVWNLDTGTAETPRFVSGEIVAGLEFRPNGRELLVARGNVLELWDLARGGWHAQAKGRWFSPDASVVGDDYDQLPSNDAGGALTLFDTTTKGVKTDSRMFRPRGRIHVVAFSADARLAAVASNRDLRPDDPWRAYVTLIDTRTGKPVYETLELPAKVVGMTLDRAGRRAALVLADQQKHQSVCCVYDLAVQEPLAPLTWHSQSENGIWQNSYRIPAVVQFDEREQRILTSHGSTAVWNLRGEILGYRRDSSGAGVVERSTQRRAILFGGGEWVVSPDHTNAVVTWNLQGEELPIDQMTQHGLPITHVALSRDESAVLTTSRDRTARIWNVKTGEPISPPLQHADVVLHGDFDATGFLVATACNNGEVRLWDARTGSQVAAPLIHTSPVHFVRFSDDGSELLSADANHVWHWSLAAPWGDSPPAIAKGKRALSNRALDDSGAVVFAPAKETEGDVAASGTEQLRRLAAVSWHHGRIDRAMDVNRGAIAKRPVDREAALFHIAQLLLLTPEDPSPILRRAKLNAMPGVAATNTPSPHADFEKLLSLKSRNWEVYFNLHQSYGARHMDEKAFAMWQEYFERCPLNGHRHTHSVAYAYQLEREGKLQQALEVFQGVLERRPDLAVNIGRVCAALGDWETARQKLSEAAEGRPSPVNTYHLALTMLKLGDVEAWRNLCERLTKDDIAAPHQLLVWTLVMSPDAPIEPDELLAMARAVHDSNFDAKDATPERIREHTLALSLLYAAALIRVGHYDEARDLLLEIRADNIGGAKTLVLLALVERQLGNLEQSKDWLHQAKEFRSGHLPWDAKADLELWFQEVESAVAAGR